MSSKKESSGIKFIEKDEFLAVRFNPFRFRIPLDELSALTKALTSIGYITHADLEGAEHGEFAVFFNSMSCSKQLFKERYVLVKQNLSGLLGRFEDKEYLRRRQFAEIALKNRLR